VVVEMLTTSDRVSSSVALAALSAAAARSAAAAIAAAFLGTWIALTPESWNLIGALVAAACSAKAFFSASSAAVASASSLDFWLHFCISSVSFLAPINLVGFLAFFSIGIDLVVAVVVEVVVLAVAVGAAVSLGGAVEMPVTDASESKNDEATATIFSSSGSDGGTVVAAVPVDSEANAAAAVVDVEGAVVVGVTLSSGFCTEVEAMLVEALLGALYAMYDCVLVS